MLDRRQPSDTALADAAMIGAAYATAVPVRRTEIADWLTLRHLAPATQASTRFVLY